ncbi:MAG: tetratricopeptide repeat protein [Acidobacteria bacterium]|nr:tetratricopeptide repeat protein [Acidobacteriota bacterium]
MRTLAKITMWLTLVLLPLVAAGQGNEPARPPSANDFTLNASVGQLLAKAQASFQRGDVATATAALEQALALESENKPARKTLIRLLLAQGRLKEAEQHVRTFARFHPTDNDALFLQALVAFQNGDLRQTSELAETCLKRGDKRAEVHKLLAMSEYLQRRFEKFEVHIRESAKLDPLDPDPHYHLGRYYFEDKRYKESLDEFKKTFELRPDHFKARYYAALVYESQNDLELAKQELQAAIKVIDQLKVRYAWPYADLGRMLVAEEDHDRGVGWLYRAIRNDPASPYARYHYAKALFRQGATFEVKQELMEAIKLDPGYGDAYYLLARYYQKTGEEQLAKETFARFEEIKKNPPPSPYGVRRW